MFRTQNNVPQVYVEKSRDFQLLGRLIDCLQAGIKFDIDTILDITSPMNIRDNLLQLLCTRVGFFPTIDIDANILKYIVAAFPYILKYKGTVKSIEYAVRTIIKSEYSTISQNSPPIVELHGQSDTIGEPCSIIIYTNINDYSKKALDEIMRYIKPIGYTYTVMSYRTTSELQEVFNTNDEASAVVSDNSANPDFGRITEITENGVTTFNVNSSSGKTIGLGDIAYSLIPETPIGGNDEETNQT